MPVDTSLPSTSASNALPITLTDITIAASAAPPLSVIRSNDFKAQLVEIEAATVMNSLCDAPVTIKASDDCESCAEPTAAATCLNGESVEAVASTGSTVPNCWLDTVQTDKITLLGRMGKKMAKLVGEGVLTLGCDGLVSAVKDVPLRVSHLWHKWIKPTPTSAPVMGQPMDYPYKVITDLDGNPYVIQGLSDEDSIEVWDFASSTYKQKSVTDFPTCVRAKIPGANQIELIGFEPLGVNDDPSLLRCLKRLQGEGTLIVKQIATAPTDICDCAECQASGQVADTTTVIELLPNPTTECSTAACPMVMAYVDGAPAWINPSEVECLQGPAGTNGTNGRDGVNGADGAAGGDCC